MFLFCWQILLLYAKQNNIFIDILTNCIEKINWNADGVRSRNIISLVNREDRTICFVKGVEASWVNINKVSKSIIKYGLKNGQNNLYYTILALRRGNRCRDKEKEMLISNLDLYKGYMRI